MERKFLRGISGTIAPLLVGGAIFLQKIAIPGTGRLISFSLITTVLALTIAFTKRILIIDARSLIWLTGLLGIICLCTAFGAASKFSTSSLMLFSVIHFMYVFRLRGSLSAARSIRIFRNCMCIIALCAFAQFQLQFVLGAKYAFAIDFLLPKEATVIGYNNLNSIYYGSTIFKSNGFFLLEPSFCSQLLALGVILELYYARVSLILILLLFGMIFTYSGTGLMLLVFSLPLLLKSERRFSYLLFGLCVSFLLLIFAAELGLSLFVDRVGEFENPRTSGYARFISMYHVLAQFVFNDISTALFGRGPGSVNEFFHLLNYEAYEPTWGKVVYEYGLVGLGAYLLFFFVVMLRNSSSRVHKAAFTFQFFFLADYLLVPFYHALLLSLISLHETDGRGQPDRPIRPWRLASEEKFVRSRA